MKNSVFLFIILPVALISATFFYKALFTSPATDRAGTVAKAFDVQASSIAELTKRNEQYKKRIKELENENFLLRSRINPDTNTSSSHFQPATKPASTRAQQNYDLEQLQRHAQANTELMTYMNSFNKQSPTNINRDLFNRFESEPVDYAWASEHETRLGQLFAGEKALAEFVPENISCKTTRCRVTIPVSSYNESNQVMENLTHALKKNSTEFEDVMVMTIPKPSTGFVDFYIARNAEIALNR